MLKKLISNSGTTLLEGVAGMAIISIAAIILGGGIVAGAGFVNKAYLLEQNLPAAQAALEEKINSGSADSIVTVTYTGGSYSFGVISEPLTDDGARLVYYKR